MSCQELLDELQAYENEYLEYRDFFTSDGEVDPGEQAQLDWIESVIAQIRQSLQAAEANGDATCTTYGLASSPLTSERISDNEVSASPNPPSSPLQDHVVAHSGPRIDDTEANWATYRTNVNSLADRLRKARQEKPQDPKSVETHKKLFEVYDRMGTAEVRRDISEAYRLSEELLDRLNEYEQARGAYEKAQKDAADKQQRRAGSRDSLQTKYDEIEYLINDVINSNEPELADFGRQIEKLKQDYDSARLSDDLNSAKTHLDNLARELETKLSAGKAAFAKGLNELGIAGQLAKFYDDQYYPGHALHDVRKKAIDLQNKRATISDYIAGNKLVVQAKRKVEENKKRASEAAKNEPKRKEAAKQAAAKFEAELKALKAELDRFVAHHYPPAGDAKSVEIRDKLEKWKTEWDATLRQGFPFPTGKYGSAFPTGGVNEIKQLFKDYQATTEAFWKKTYETPAANIKAKLEPVLDKKKWTDEAMKAEQAKVVAIKKEMDDAVAKKDYYQASIKQTALSLQLHRFSSLIYTVPKGPDMVSVDVTIKPRVLGKPVTGPAATTLLMLLDETGTKAINDPEGVKLNDSGLKVLADWERLAKQQADWSKKFGIVKSNAGKGAEQVKKIESAAAAIAARTKGKEGEYLRDRIQEYADAVREAEGMLKEIKGSLSFDIKIAEEYLRMSGLTGQKIAKKRDVNKAEKEVQKEEKRIEDIKSKTRTHLGVFASIFSTPSWIRLGVAAVAIVGELAFEEEIPTDDLKRLQSQLDNVTAELETIEDAENLSNAQAKNLEHLKSVQKHADAVDKFIKYYEGKVRPMETSVVEALNSGATAGAGAAIEKRSAIFKAAMDSTELMGTYLSETDRYVTQIDDLKTKHESFASTFDNQNLKPKAYREWVAATATNNADTLAEFNKYIERMRATSRENLSYLSKTGSDNYFAGFDKMPSVVMRILVERNTPKPASQK
jgi:hypothetical protein